ncbi:hypothetical protein NA57DRAFT_79169 [Rhizodiscina lignyota]|uniref:Mid2 domain-containing protein n=1 Tax=Rhizodiscina lignyota TaxID=1504668 RepID=A0A9P4I7K9_9PEZI|nr:hypothetical protein NA57DRAFT_79169 [Rhizodiscina lignyota]
MTLLCWLIAISVQSQFSLASSVTETFTIVTTFSADTTYNTASIYGVLLTALPSSLLAEATNTVEFSSDIAAQFSSGTPKWFQTLPSDVQNYIIAPGPQTLISTRVVDISTTTSSEQPRSTSSTLASSRTSTPSTSVSPTQTPLSTGLGTGAKIAVGILAPVAAIACTAVVALILWNRKRMVRSSGVASHLPASALPELRTEKTNESRFPWMRREETKTQSA